MLEIAFVIAFHALAAHTLVRGLLAAPAGTGWRASVPVTTVLVAALGALLTAAACGVAFAARGAPSETPAGSILLLADPFFIILPSGLASFTLALMLVRRFFNGNGPGRSPIRVLRPPQGAALATDESPVLQLVAMMTGVPALAIMFFAVGCHVGFLDDGIHLRAFFRLQETIIPYANVREVRHIGGAHPERESKTRRSRYELRFADGSTWSTGSDFFPRDPALDTRIAVLVSARAHRAITLTDFE